jgi:hypothetical protein
VSCPVIVKRSTSLASVLCGVLLPGGEPQVPTLTGEDCGLNLVVSTTSVLPSSQCPRLSPSQFCICAGTPGRPSVGMIRVSWTISIWIATIPGAWKMRMPLL